MMTARDAFRAVKNRLFQSGIEEPEQKAKVIVSHVLGIGLGEIYGNDDMPDGANSAIHDMAERCAMGEPVEYVTGKAYFRHIELDVTNDVLIPRSETELVTGLAIDLIKDKGYKTAVDICTGSGCIAISLATETGADIDACDISANALDTAKRNAAINGVDNVCFFVSDMFENLSKTYDIIVCNPPYVSESEYAELDESVRLYEPKNALIAGDGLMFYRIIAECAMAYLTPGGAVVLEIGADQGDDVKRLIKQTGFLSVDIEKDYAGRDRIVYAFRQ